MRLIKFFLVNAVIMTAAALFMRIIDFSFNVYVSQTVGTVGMGLYSLIMSVYSFAVTFATSGINLAVTRIISEAIGEGDEGRIRKSVLCCVLYSLILGILSAAALFFLASALGNGVLADGRTVSSLRLLAFSCVFLSVNSAFAGYFTAVRRVYKNAVVSVIEQFTRIAVTVFAFSKLRDGNIEYACVSLCAGLVTSECLAFLLTSALYAVDVKRNRYRYSADPLPVRKLLGITVPVSISSYIRSGLLTLEHVLIPRGLKKRGDSYETALSSYGVIHGMSFPVVLFPQVFLSSFSSLLIPELAQCRARGDRKRINVIIGRIVQITLLFSLFVSALMICFGDRLGIVIYGSAESGKYIKYIAPLIPIMYLDNAVDTMLKGIGEQFWSMCVNIIDAAVSVLMVYSVVPSFGITGYIVTVYVCEALNFVLSLGRLLSKTGAELSVRRHLLLPLASAIGAAWTASLFFRAVRIESAGGTVELIVRISVSLVFYIAAVCFSGALDREDRAWLRGVIK